MLHVFQSNQVERLVDALVANIAAVHARGRGSVFDAVEIVVPNWNLQTYLKFEIAARAGIAANLRFRPLEDFLADCLPANMRARYRLLSERMVQMLLIELLSDEAFLAREGLGPLRDYLYAGAGRTAGLLAVGTGSSGQDGHVTELSGDGLDLRRFQLARELSRLFREYEYSRRDMLEAWPVRPVVEREPFRDIERWQRTVWLELFGPEGRLAALERATGLRHARLTQLFWEVPPTSLVLPACTHVFGLSYVAPVFERIFEVFRPREELVCFYTLNPCQEYWEDVRPGVDEEEEAAPLAARPGEAPERSLFARESDTPALRLWGRPGRDNHRMLNRLTDFGHDDSLFVDPTALDVTLTTVEREKGPPAPTLLQALQDDIRTRHEQRPPAPPDARFDDESVTFLACPSLQREVEVVASEIWRLMEASGGTLRFNDIAVVVNHAERELYQTHIRAVFKDTFDIPNNIIDVQSAGQSRVLEAAELLFSLPFGDFRRREMLKLVTHPCVVAGFADVDPERWMQWCHELHILHGADHTDHADTYIEHDLLNWQQGMRRLVLGAFMSDHRSGEERAFESADGHLYLPHEYPHTELDEAASLNVLVQSLIADARYCRRARMPLGRWASFLGELLSAYLTARDGADEHDLMRLHNILGELGAQDLTGQPVSYRVAYEFVLEAMGVLERHSAQYLAGGVVVTSFLPMRPIPFKVVFVTGMGEGRFPSSDRHNPLDLRLAARREGDVRSREQDKYMFLETLVSTRERLYLSWVSRDGRTGDPLEPSTVVRELQYMLGGFEGPAALARRIQHHPLRRFDPVYFPELFDDATGPAEPGRDDDAERARPKTYVPGAREEARLRALRLDLQRHCEAHGLTYPTVEELRAHVDPQLWEILRRGLGLVDVAAVQALSNERLEAVVGESIVGEGIVGEGIGEGVAGDAARDVGPPERVSLSLWQLRRFLECPLQASANLLAGLREEEAEDLFAIENEAFETGSLYRTRLLRDVFLRALAAAAAGGEAVDDRLFAEAYARRARHLELQGIVPTGLFGAAERRRHLQVLGRWRENMAALLDLEESGPARAHSLEIVRFGRAGEHVVTDRILDSIVLDITLGGGPAGSARDVAFARGLRRVRVELSGETQPLSADRSTSMILQARDAARPRDFVAGMLDHAFLAAAGLTEPGAWRRMVVNSTATLVPGRSAFDNHQRALRPMSRAEARRYLEGLVTELLAGVHDYLMPVEAVFDWLGTPGRPREEARPFAHCVATALGRGCSSLYGPVRHPERYAPPGERTARRLIARRFAPLLAPAEPGDPFERGPLERERVEHEAVEREEVTP